MMMELSVVIPTRNRRESLLRLLQSLSSQKYQLKEVIIVDASDQEIDVAELQAMFKSFPIRYLRSIASVCSQRNTGIKTATSEFIFLCDDDIEITDDYLLTLMT